MPCHDPLSEYSVDLARLKDKLNKTTDLLCEAFSVIETNGLDEDCSFELQEWGEKHKEEDLKEIQNRLGHLSGAEMRKIVKFLDSL